MSESKIKATILYIIILTYVVVTQLCIPSQYNKIYDLIINPISWLLFFCFAIYISKDISNRYREKRNIIQTLIIIMLIYMMMHFASGLIFTYQKNPYNTSILGIIKNLWAYGSIAILQEYVRSIFVTSRTKQKAIYILTIILFVIIDINFANIPHYFTSAETGFKFLITIVYESIIRNILLCYIVNKAGFLAALIYKLPFIAITIFLPILPNINWFLEVIVFTILIFIIFAVINYIEIKSEKKVSKKTYHRANPLYYIPFLILLISLVGFIVGWFKYYPVALMSNSMRDKISRGDVVIVEKINKDQLKNIKTGDVIEYILDDSVVIHRVIQIQKQNKELIFTTKGDNNETPDAFKVRENQVVGLVKFKISYIGYPSVWLNEIFKKNRPNVET